jgi:peptidoglycan hydrolase CwlO-like protein
MTKRIIKLLWVILITIVAVLILLTAYTVGANKTTDKEINKAESLWQLVDKMDSLRDLKAECADNLWIADSAKFLKWMTWYCDSWDEEIISLRNQISELSKKSYEGLM